MEGVIDTNVLISTIVKEDEKHVVARKILEDAGKWHIPAIVFHELVCFFKAEGISAEIAEKILKNRKVQFEPIEEEDAAFSIKNIRSLKDYNNFLVLSVALRKSLPSSPSTQNSGRWPRNLA